MDEDRLQSTLHSMREDWDRRARENARYFVATHRADWTDEEFFASGEQELAQDVLNDMGNVCQGRDPASMRVLEIGCGAGRVTRALARVFGEVHAVDVSGEMVAHARAALAGLPNAFVYQNNGMDLSVVPDLPFDFAFSVIVFQHIPSRGVIENYFREIARLLRPGALFKVQVQGLPEISQPEPQPEPEPPAPAQPVPTPEPEPEPAPAAKLPLVWRLTGKIPLPIRKRFLRPIRRWMLSIPPATACPPEPEPEPVIPPPPPESYFSEPDTWVGIMFTPEYAQAVCDNAGFELRYQRGAGERYYWLWCFKK
ncbi:MAG TPA: methyltransferase domain-containing protein [Bryobacteraceae bacterium]|nr:methyltransferase domain-containing protein [Bryobacteraceae bacterium]